MKNVELLFEAYCQKKNIPYSPYRSIKSYDKSTLFCSAGMQQYKKLFQDSSVKERTIANLQACLRVNDLEELGDGKHAAYFNMLGLFSFRDWTIQQAIDFWLGFIKELGLTLEYVTIHPDREQWSVYYPYDLDVRLDNECRWSDGNIEG